MTVTNAGASDNMGDLDALRKLAVADDEFAVEQVTPEPVRSKYATLTPELRAPR